MVRLVFRPYTQIRRTICTSVALRTFIRVSPEFVLLKHSSPSFGSLCMYSNSNPPQVVSWLLVHISQLSFPLRPRTYTHKLAHASDSLVPVSRRVTWNRQLKQSPCTPTRNLRGMLIGNSSRLHINALQQAINQWPMKHAPIESSKSSATAHVEAFQVRCMLGMLGGQGCWRQNLNGS